MSKRMERSPAARWKFWGKIVVSNTFTTHLLFGSQYTHQQLHQLCHHHHHHLTASSQRREPIKVRKLEYKCYFIIRIPMLFCCLFENTFKPTETRLLPFSGFEQHKLCGRESTFGGPHPDFLTDHVFYLHVTNQQTRARD